MVYQRSVVRYLCSIYDGQLLQVQYIYGMLLEEYLERFSLKEIIEINNLTEEEVLEILVEEGHIVLPVV